MALTDRILALTNAIATAFNQRVTAPVSGYDLAVLNGYTGTQQQWLASLVPQATPQLPLATVLERFDTVAAGGVWPAKFSIATAGATATVDSAGRGAINITTANQGARGVPQTGAFLECGAMVTLRSNSATATGALGLQTFNLDTATLGSSTGVNGIALLVDWANQQIRFNRNGALLTGGTNGGTNITAVTLSTGVDYKVRLEVVANFVRAKIWAATDFEPALWRMTYDLTGLGSSTGYVSIGATATAAAIVAFDDLAYYGLEENGATSFVPGVVALATAGEVAGLTGVEKAVTPGRIPIATESQRGVAALASVADAQAGTNTSRVVTPAGAMAAARRFAATYAKSPVNYTGAAQWVRLGRATTASDANGGEFEATIANLGQFGGGPHGLVHLSVGMYGRTSFAGIANLELFNDGAWDIGYVKSDYAIDIWAKQSPYNDEIGVTLLSTNSGVLTMDQVSSSAPTGYVSFEKRAPGKNYAGGLDLKGHGARGGNGVNEAWFDMTHVFLDLAITTASALSRDTVFFAVPSSAQPPITAMLPMTWVDSGGNWVSGHAWIGSDGGGRVLSSVSIASGKDLQLSGTYRRKAAY